MPGTDASALDRVQELFDFLQGQQPEGYHVDESYMPQLSPEHAWTVIWYLGNLYWAIPDHIERCGVCGDLYDSEREGECLDYGDAPYHFCESCEYGLEAEAKRALAPAAT